MIEALCRRTVDAFQIDAPSSDQSCFNLADISKQHPTIVGRTLLYIAVCLQQLPPDFDTNRLSIQAPVESCMEKIIVTVQALITSDDELASSTEGLECLMLQGLYHLNAGNLRRSWLTFRRALNIAQLMGIHRKAEPDAPLENQTGRELWYQLVQADRYLALLLGLPCGTADDVIAPHETFDNPKVDHDRLFQRKLTLIASRIIERNQAEHSAAFANTQEIDERLEHLAKEVSSEWWIVPTSLPSERTSETAKLLDRIITQIWYFQLESLLHLPFMLRASTERRYEYSRFSCLKAAREMLWRYLALRSLGNEGLCCKVIDFTAFTGVIILLLRLLDPAQQKEGKDGTDPSGQIEKDHELVKTVLASMEERAAGGKDAIATQSVNVIKTLLEINSPSGRTTNNLRLTIPYFGTLSIARTCLSTSRSDGMTPQLNTSRAPPTTNSSGFTTTITQDAMHQHLPDTAPADPIHQQSLQQSTNQPTWPDLPSTQPPTSAPTKFPIVNFTSSQLQFQPQSTTSHPSTSLNSTPHLHQPSSNSTSTSTSPSTFPGSTQLPSISGDTAWDWNGQGLGGAMQNGMQGKGMGMGMGVGQGHGQGQARGRGGQDTLFFDSLLESDIDAGWMCWDGWRAV